MRKLVIGDIHGGAKALLALMDMIKPKPEDQLIFLGDYVDGWSGSFEVIEYLIHLAQERKPPTYCPPVFLRGNHDDLLYRYLQLGDAPENWIKHGGQSSIDSYAKRSKEEIEQHITFLASLVNYHEQDDCGFFHAGFQNLNGPAFEHYHTTTYWDRTLWEMALATDKNLTPQSTQYPPRLALYKEIFIGHTPTTRMHKTTPLRAMNVWNVDTGAAFTGPLTAMDIDTKEFWQSEPVQRYYPDELGRNKKG